MPEEGLKVIIGADVNQGVAGINKFNQAVSKIKPNINSATLAMSNMGRVAQDLPFGFLGIANNLNPLLESFQRLRAEAGSNIGALKALGASLMGAGGIGLALSVVSSLLIVFGDRLFGTGKAAKAAKDANEEFKKSLKSVAEVQDDAVASAQGQIATVNALAKVITDTNKPYKDRKRALEELKEVNKSYFGDLTLETAKLGILTARVQEYTKALIQQAIVKKFADAIADTAKAISDQQRVLDKATTSMQKFNNELTDIKDKAAKSIGRFGGGTAKAALDIAAATDKANEATKKFREESDKLNQLSEQSVADENELGKAIETSVKFKDLDTKATKKLKEEVDNLRHARILDLEELQHQQRILEIVQGKQFAPKKAAFEGGVIVPSIQISPDAFKSFDVLDRLIGEKMDDLNEKVRAAMINIKSTLVAGFAESVGALIGGEELKSAIGAFVGMIGDALITIGKMAIQTGIEILALKKALTAMFTNPGTLIAVGAGLVALGSLIKTKIPKFAEGGIATRPTLGIFGEAGPEALVPLNQAGNFFGQSMHITADWVLRGKDLRAVNIRAEKSNNRIT